MVIEVNGHECPGVGVRPTYNRAFPFAFALALAIAIALTLGFAASAFPEGSRLFLLFG